MRGTYDKEADAAYLYLSDEKITRTTEMNTEINFDYDALGKVVGIEFLNAKSQLADATLISFQQLS